MSQNKVPLQKLPSSELAQSALIVHEQVLAPPTQTPPAQVSPVVQPLPSSHAAVLLAWAQPVTVLQESVVQPLLSLQKVATTTAEPLQAPTVQVSPVVQAFKSSQGRVLLA